MIDFTREVEFFGNTLILMSRIVACDAPKFENYFQCPSLFAFKIKMSPEKCSYSVKMQYEQSPGIDFIFSLQEHTGRIYLLTLFAVIGYLAPIISIKSNPKLQKKRMQKKN